MNILAPISQASDAVSKAYVDGLLAEYTKTANLGALASKDSLAFSELTGKPTTLAGYGVSNVDVSGYIKGGSTITCKGDLMSLTDDNQNYNWRIASIIDGAQLQVGYRDNSSNKGKFYFTGMWGEDLEAFFVRANGAYFDGADVYFRNTGKTQFAASALFQSGIKISAGQAISFLDSDGVEHKMTYDSGKKAFMVEGDFFATGESAASNAGTSVTDIGQLVTRVESLEQSKSSNVEIKVSALSTYNQQTLTSLAMTQLTGLTALIANSMLSGFYNKVIDKSGTYPKIWNYSATRSSNVISLFFAYGDGFNSKEGCRLDYNTTTLRWDVSIEEL